MAIKNHYFVYDWVEMKLYANAVTSDEAERKYDELRIDKFARQGWCIAAIGSFTDKDNRELCEALGNAIDFYMVQRMMEDGFEFEGAIINLED